MSTDLPISTPLPPVLSNRKILMVGGPKKAPEIHMDLHEVLKAKDLESSLEIISEVRPDLVIYFSKDKAEDIEEHVMTWLIEGFRGKFIVFDPRNRIKDYEVLMESQVIDDYYSGPVSPTRFKAIIKSQLTQDLRFALPRAMTTFDLFRNLFDRGLNAIFFFNENLEKCVAANLKAEKITGYTLYELRHKGLEDILHPDHFGATQRTLRRAGRQYYDVQGMTVIKNRLDEHSVMSFSCGVFNFGRKSFVKFEVQEQTTQVGTAKTKTATESKTDPLTKLGTQEALFRAVNQSLGENSKANLSLVLCNIKPGKNVHRLKDRSKEESELFTTLAKSLQEQIRQTDTLARLGHYQFAILVPKVGPERVQGLIRRLQTILIKIPALQKEFFNLEMEMAQCPPQAYPFMHLLHSTEIPTQGSYSTH